MIYEILNYSFVILKTLIFKQFQKLFITCKGREPRQGQEGRLIERINVESNFRVLKSQSPILSFPGYLWERSHCPLVRYWLDKCLIPLNA